MALAHGKLERQEGVLLVVEPEPCMMVACCFWPLFDSEVGVKLSLDFPWPPCTNGSHRICQTIHQSVVELLLADPGWISQRWVRLEVFVVDKLSCSDQVIGQLRFLVRLVKPLWLGTLLDFRKQHINMGW
jgi:hypothetical protein